MNKTWLGVGSGLIIIGILVFMGSGRNLVTPTPTPLVNPLIVATTTDTSTTTTETPTSEPTVPRSAFNTPLVFNLGYQKVFVGGLIVTMTDLADSRCKPDVQCIWAGEVSASFTIVGGGITPSQTITLGTVTKKSITVGGYLITLVAADESAATVTVSKTTDTASTTPALGTITGTVTIGPNCPVERVGEPCPTPVAAYTSRSVIVYNAAGTAVMTKKSLDTTGRFTLALAPGNYQLQIDPAGIGAGEKKSVLVTKDQTTTVTFVIDTGIR